MRKEVLSIKVVKGEGRRKLRGWEIFQVRYLKEA